MTDLLSPCPWGQCEHVPNAHSRDHCHACSCVKPPPPPPGAGFPAVEDLPQHITTDETELEPLQMDICGVCSAYVADRDKHVSVHEREVDRATNILLTLSHLERLVGQLRDRVANLEEALNQHDRRDQEK